MEQVVDSHEEPEIQLAKILNEKINYSQFSENGFSISYPNWPDIANGDVELTVSKGYCSVAVNSEKIPSLQWYEMILDSVTKQEGKVIISDDDGQQIKYSMEYMNNTLVSDNRIFECQEKSIVVTLTCIEELDELMQRLSDEIYPSASCQEKEIEIKKYQDDDFSIEYPDWDDTLDGENERLLGVTKGVCSIIVDKHNALPKDIFNWLGKAIEEKEDHNLLTSSADGDVYNIIYQFSHEKNTLTSTTKVFYCNYQSYLTQVLCVDEYITEDDREMRNHVLDSSRCVQVYEIPTPKKIEKEKEEVKETEPEIIEEIEDEIVKTNAGEEFGIDEEMVVYFINSNEFFSKVMKDFPKTNLLIEDDDRELRLRVQINNAGKITRLEDGEYGDADVTLIIPLRDALNIFNNAENINPITLIAFAANVKTEPVEIKNQVIQKVLRGEYN